MTLTVEKDILESIEWEERPIVTTDDTVFPKVSLSVVVPAYNCRDRINKTIRHLQDTLTNICSDYELIVVDDGSYDNTAEEVMRAAKKDPKIKVISYAPNKGKGYAVKQGVLISRGKNVVFIDGDSEVKPSVIADYIKVLNEADVVVASKYHPDSNVRAPLLRRFLSKGFHLLVRLTLRIQIKDTQAGLKAGRSDAFKQIFTKVLVKKYAFDAEMLTVSSLLGHRIVEMPIDIDLNSHFKLKEIARMFIDLAGIAYRLRVVKWYQRNLEKERPHYRPIIPI